MTPLDPAVASLIDQIANALQATVLLVQHLERRSAATARDIGAIKASLTRATTALAWLHEARR